MYPYSANPDEPPEFQEMWVRKCIEGYDKPACHDWTINQVL